MADSDPGDATKAEPPPVDEPQQVDVSDEYLAVQYKRYLEAKEAGMTIVEAKMFAESEIDIGRLRSLLKTGCPADLLASILL